jgi:hypothetical protein
MPGRAKNGESEHGAISRISLEGRSPLPAAAWSGYGCKPAARLTRSASLFMTPTGLRVCAAAETIHITA